MATIIKRNTTDPRGASFNFADMSREADTYLEEIRARAEKMVAEARAEAEGIRQRAQAEGFLVAQQAAEQTLDIKISRTLMPAVTRVAEQLEAARQVTVTQWEKHIVALAAAIAAKMVRREIAEHPEITLDLVRESLTLAAGNPQLVVRLHPDDYAALGERAAIVAQEIAPVGETKVVADEQISPGGCRVETLYGTIDQQIETQAKRIEEELT